MKKTYGYIRVSTKEQNEERQVIAMQEFGVSDNCMVIDKQSGKDFNRPGYRRLMKKLKPEDTLVIKSSTGSDEIMTKYWNNGDS